MSEVYLSQLAGSHSKWLSVRQSVVAGNIANSNTPGYRAKEVVGLEDTGKLFSSMLQTNGKHLSAGLGNVEGVGVVDDNTWEVYHSGANVSLPQEVMKAGEVASAYELNTSVMKSFHRMVISTFGT